jgi:hypothetical protein
MNAAMSTKRLAVRRADGAVPSKSALSNPYVTHSKGTS